VDGLGERKERILRAVVVEYVTDAEPIASERLVKKYELGVRSATVRNELAEMSDLGYLEQPHTSAGRIPSDRGYRYFVDRLFMKRPIHNRLRQQVDDATSEREALRELLSETTKALARLTQLMSVATTLRDAQVTVRNAVITAIGPGRALLVVILQNGEIKNRIIDCPPETTLEHLGRANEILAPLVENLPLGRLRKLEARASGDPHVDGLTAASAQTVRSLAKESVRGSVITEGEEFMLGQPEFQRDTDLMQKLVQSLQNEEQLYNSIVEPAELPHKVTIGSENASPSMKRFTIIRDTFYVGEDEAGYVGLVGPTRLNYEKSVSLLKYTSKAISETLTTLLS
jgi:heat-inducible transcriptional repressor